MSFLIIQNFDNVTACAYYRVVLENPEPDEVLWLSYTDCQGNPTKEEVTELQDEKYFTTVCAYMGTVESNGQIIFLEGIPCYHPENYEGGTFEVPVYDYSCTKTYDGDAGYTNRWKWEGFLNLKELTGVETGVFRLIGIQGDSTGFTEFRLGQEFNFDEVIDLSLSDQLGAIGPDIAICQLPEDTVLEFAHSADNGDSWGGSIFIKLYEVSNYNLILDIRIDDGVGPTSNWADQQSFRLLNSGLTIDRIDWGDGNIETVDIRPTSEKTHRYTKGNYRVRMHVTAMSPYLDLRWANITRIVKLPGLIDSEALNTTPTKIDFGRNKIPTDGLIPLLTKLNEISPTNITRDSNALLRDSSKLGYGFMADGQLGHIKYTPVGDSKGFYRTAISGQEYLQATAQEIQDYSRSQNELDLFRSLQEKNWYTSASFDRHYRTNNPAFVSGILNDGEMGDINLGVEQFHVVFTQAGSILKGKLVRRNRVNGLFNDERFPADVKRQIAAQELYLRYQFKKPGESTWGHDVWMIVSKASPKLVDDLNINPTDYPEGTQVRAEYMGKYGLCSADVTDQYRNLMTAAPFQITLTYV